MKRVFWAAFLVCSGLVPYWIVSDVTVDSSVGANILERDEENSPGSISSETSVAVADETINETIARIERDVVVKGSILSIPGQESAFFQIEANPDQQFSVSSQLMDGFVITAITPNKVVLKNQVGEETISLYY